MVHEQNPNGHEALPWEAPGAARLDCEPHRGVLLRRLGSVGFWMGFFVVLPTIFVALPIFFAVRTGPALDVLQIVVPVVVFLLPGLTLAAVAWALARRDLAAIRSGFMDSDGWRDTRAARWYGAGGVLLNGLALLVWIAVLLRAGVAG